MEFKKANTNTSWVETFFDVSEPYLYVIVLPPLIMLALGFRRQALVFTFGAAVFSPSSARPEPHERRGLTARTETRCHARPEERQVALTCGPVPGIGAPETLR